MTQLISSILAVGLAATIATIVNGASGTNIMDRWKLQLPRVSLVDENNTVVMDYGISERISSDNIRAEIFTEDCEYPLLTNGILSQTIGAQGAHVFQIDPKNLATNPEVFSTIDYPGADGAKMRFCLRYMLWSGPETDNGSIMVNYLETILILSFDLTAGSFLDVSVEYKDKFAGGDRNNLTVREGYDADGYLCDPFTYESTGMPKEGFPPGSIICICALLNEMAIEEGMYLKGIDEFVWHRDRIIQGETVRTSQYSVKDGVAYNALSSTERITPYFTVFKTILFADFYILPGIVTGSGRISFAFSQDGLERRTAEKPFPRSSQEDAGLDANRGIEIVSEVGRRSSEKTYPRSLQQDPNPNIGVSIRVTNWRPPLKGSKTSGGSNNISCGRSLLLFIVSSALTTTVLCL